MTCSFVLGFLDVPFAMNTSKPFRLLLYSFIPAHSSLGANRFVNLFWAMRVERGFVTSASLNDAILQPAHNCNRSFHQSPVSKCNIAECFDYAPLIGRHDSRKNATHDSIWKIRTRAGNRDWDKRLTTDSSNFFLLSESGQSASVFKVLVTFAISSLER